MRLSGLLVAGLVVNAMAVPFVRTITSVVVATQVATEVPRVEGPQAVVITLTSHTTVSPPHEPSAIIITVTAQKTITPPNEPSVTTTSTTKDHTHVLTYSTPEHSTQSVVPGSCEDVHPQDVKYCHDVENAHNRHRRNHTVPDIHWDPELYNSASIVVQTCNFTHKMNANGGGYGQNLNVGTCKDNVQQAITNGWYNGEAPHFLSEYYGQEIPTPMTWNNDSWEQFGHMTQLVWKHSTRVGCATNWCKILGCTPNLEKSPPDCPTGVMDKVFGHWITACHYRDTGNIVGFFDANILPPRGDHMYEVPDIEC